MGCGSGTTGSFVEAAGAACSWPCRECGSELKPKRFDNPGVIWPFIRPPGVRPRPKLNPWWLKPGVRPERRLDSFGVNPDRFAIDRKWAFWGSRTWPLVALRREPHIEPGVSGFGIGALGSRWIGGRRLPPGVKSVGVNAEKRSERLFPFTSGKFRIRRLCLLEGFSLSSFSFSGVVVLLGAAVLLFLELEEEVLLSSGLEVGTLEVEEDAVLGRECSLGAKDLSNGFSSRSKEVFSFSC